MVEDSQSPSDLTGLFFQTPLVHYTRIITLELSAHRLSDLDDAGQPRESQIRLKSVPNRRRRQMSIMLAYFESQRSKIRSVEKSNLGQWPSLLECRKCE